ncbi:hypothetical protein ACJJTC_017914 [Scirpophaga incertulas]
MSARGSRLVRAIDFYLKNSPLQFDSNIVLSKVKLLSSSDKGAKSSFTVDKGMCNGGDTLHGGFIAACVDTLSTFAHLGSTGKIAWTMNLYVDFIAAAKIGEEVTAQTLLIRNGNYPVMETIFSKSDGTIVAKGTTSMLNGNDKYQKLVRDIYNLESDSS